MRTCFQSGLPALTALLILTTTAAAAGDASRLITNLEAGKKQTVVTYGTSLTAGGAWVKQLTQALNTHYPDQAVVINSAKSGMWSTWGVKHLDQRVIAKKPDTVIIEFGINDAFLKYNTSVQQAHDNLDSMIDRIKAAHSDCEIILMVMNPPISVHLERRPKILDYYQMYREVAKDRKVLLIDHFPAWQSILNEGEERFRKLVPDGIHPNAEGCRTVITPAILKAIGLTSAQADD